MPRPPLCFCENIHFKPEVTYFKPQGVAISGLEIISLSLEEVEAYRLRHLQGLEQREAAERMHASTSTYQRILNSAYSKIADFIINGKALQITKH